jgi:hypothetical protein
MDILERMYGALRSGDNKNVATVERRRAWRVIRRVGLVGFRDNGDKLDLMGIDFSPGGMRIESPKKLKKGEMLRLTVAKLRSGDDRRVSLEAAEDVLLAQVVWCAPRRDLTLECGLQFMVDDVKQRPIIARFLLDDCKVGISNPKEKRKVPRMPTEMKGLVALSDGSTVDVRVLDLGLGGALINAPRDIAKNTILDLKIFLGGDGSTLQCKGAVVRSMAAGATSKVRTYDMGIYFTDVPADHKERLVGFLSKKLSGA